MWKWLAYTKRYSFIDTMFFVIALKAVREDNWPAWGVVIAVWLAVMFSTQLYFDKKKQY